MLSFPLFAASVLAEQIALHNERIKRDQADLARLKSLPPQEAAIEMQYRQMRAVERQAQKQTIVNAKTSIF